MKKTIKEWRELCHLSQEELAARTGKSQVTISHWETGKTKPTKIEDAAKLRKALMLESEDSIIVPYDSTFI